jgi:Uma2 family endonuclease
MSQLKTSILTDTWVKATWDEYLQAIDELDSEKAKGYYYDGCYRIEMTPLGTEHAKDHHIVFLAVSLYAILRRIPLNGFDACSYRKTGVREVQPDISYYIGEKANVIPHGTSIIDLDRYPAPDLVIEISKSTLPDDLGKKRLLYEDLGVAEYWVVDVVNAQVIAFKMIEGGSQRIDRSQILPGLDISLLNEALRRTRESNHSQVGQWLMEQFQQHD